MRFSRFLRFAPLLLLMFFSQDLLAHTTNQVDHIISYKFSDAGKRLEVKFIVDFGFETATNMLYLFDADKNGTFNGDEKPAAGVYVLRQWLEEFTVTANNTKIEAESVHYEFSGGEIHFLSGGFTVTMTGLYIAKVDSPEIDWELANKFIIYPVGFYKYTVRIHNAIVLGKPGTSGKKTNPWGLRFSLQGFNRDVGVTTFKLDEENDVMQIYRTKKQKTSSQNEKAENLQTAYSENEVNFDDDDEDEIADKRSSRNEKDDRFISILGREPFSIEGLIGLLIAFVLGMYHAMSPGHGKALVGSYLITSKGTFRDAIILALTVTVTHTGSVFLFGVVILVASQNLTPSTFVPYLTLASGIFIIMIGFWIVITRSEHWKPHSHNHGDGHGHSHSHGHTHEHTHEHEHEHKHSHESGTEEKVCKITGILRKSLISDDELMPVTDRLALPVQDLTREIFDIDDSEIEIIVNPEHEHVLKLLEKETKPKKKRRGVSLKELLVLGITGGMVPCPTAIVVLLIAVALGKTVYGLMLIISFSFGLAFILGALGVFMVISKKFIAKSGKFTKLAQIAPVISGIVITYIGWLLIFGALHQLGIITFELNFLE